MKAELKHLHSPDVDDLRAFVPSDPERFAVFVQAMVGPDDDDASESFDLMVCSSAWIHEQAQRAPVIGIHHIVMATYDYDTLARTVREFCERCEGATWKDIAPKVARLGHWEFDDYRDTTDAE